MFAQAFTIKGAKRNKNMGGQKETCFVCDLFCKQ